MGWVQVSEKELAKRKSGERTRRREQQVQRSWGRNAFNIPELQRKGQQRGAFSAGHCLLPRLDQKLLWSRDHLLLHCISPHLEALQSHFSSLGLSFPSCKMETIPPVFLNVKLNEELCERVQLILSPSVDTLIPLSCTEMSRTQGLALSPKRMTAQWFLKLAAHQNPLLTNKIPHPFSPTS